MSAFRRLCEHTAVSSSSSLYAYFSVPGRATSHFYVNSGGGCEQYIDTRARSTASLYGNHDSITVETEDEYPSGWSNASDVPRWTAAQVERLADMYAWLHETHDIPLVLCPNSRPGTVGIAYHRQGIDPWRVTGGEYWSKSGGKVCPGDRRVAQIDDVLARAKQIVSGAKPPTIEEEPTVASWSEQVPDRAVAEFTDGKDTKSTRDELLRYARYDAWQAYELGKKNAAAIAALRGDVAKILAALESDSG